MDVDEEQQNFEVDEDNESEGQRLSSKESRIWNKSTTSGFAPK